MNSQNAAAIGLRLMGVWLVLESFLTLLYRLFGPAGPFASLPLGAHRRVFEASGAPSPDIDLHTTLYLALHYPPFLVGIVPGLVTGCLLLIFSKPLGRLLARNLRDC